MKDLANNISKEKNLEINLPKFGQEMMDVYYRYSSVRLAMNYYTYNEMLGDKDALTTNELYNSFFKVIENGIKNKAIGKELEEEVKNIDNIRNQVIQIMKGLTSLVDIFNIYEYILNRVEYRFKDGSHIVVKDDEVFSTELMQYILSSKDNVVVNARISEAVRQLPFRMSKAKFYELLKEGMKVYKDSEKASVDDFVYMISSSAMIYVDEYAEKISEDISEIVKCFESVDFAKIDEAEYNQLRDKLTFAVEYIQNSVDDYMLLQELINDVYVLLLSAPYADTTCEEREILLSIINSANEEEAEEALVKLEGKQERYYSKYSQCEYIIKDILEKNKDMVESLMLSALYNSLDVISTLESGSNFVEFNVSVDHTIAGEAYVLEKYSQLEHKLAQFFKEHNKLVNRAVMAHILAALPVFFNNTEEIQSYVYTCVSGCTDMAEKTACAEIFATMMEEDGFNVVS